VAVGRKGLICGEGKNGCRIMTMLWYIPSFWFMIFSNHGMTLVPQPPYSPDLVTVDFLLSIYLFICLSFYMLGIQFPSSNLSVFRPYSI
jgi:hypothetical protein